MQSTHTLTFLLTARAPGTFDDPVSFATVEISPDKARHLLGLMARAAMLKQEISTFDAFTAYEASANFFSAESPVYSEDAVQDALALFGDHAGHVILLSEDIGVEFDVADAIRLDVRRVEVDSESVYWTGLYSDDTRVESARLSKDLLERVAAGDDIAPMEAIST